MAAAAPGKSRHVVVGISGGVDSAVSAWRLQQAGYRVSGLFMVNWTEDEAGYCTAADDFQSARAVCEELAIPLHRADFSALYRRGVFQSFLDDYAAGKTPNPDILCNREVKFGPFIEHAKRLGADAIATGHYARLEHRADGPHLMRAVDDNKDQTYFLATVDRERFQNVLFPLGDLDKPQVRELARRAGLPNHARHDSTGICFIGERQLQPFLERYLDPRPGPIVSVAGTVVGQHRGLASYTLGQRRGLAVGGQRGAGDAPWYVVAKQLDANTLIVSQQRNDPRLLSTRLSTAAFHWIYPLPAACSRVSVRIRHRQPLQAATAQVQPNGGITLDFDSAQRAVAIGQYAVLYDGQECLGGGEICSVGCAADTSANRGRAAGQALPSRSG